MGRIDGGPRPSDDPGTSLRSFSADLIAGLPGLTVARWRQQLHAALALGPDHLSLYDLQLEEGAGLPFGGGGRGRRFCEDHPSSPQQEFSPVRKRERCNGFAAARGIIRWPSGHRTMPQWMAVSSAASLSRTAAVNGEGGWTEKDSPSGLCSGGGS